MRPSPEPFATQPRPPRDGGGGHEDTGRTRRGPDKRDRGPLRGDLVSPRVGRGVTPLHDLRRRKSGVDAGADGQPIVGMTNSASVRMPAGQRVVIVLSL